MIVLDTHAWIWAVSNPELLSVPARDAFHEAVDAGRVILSSISVWEIALLAQKGRLELTMHISDWIAKSEALPFFHFIPVNNGIALKSVNLPGPLHPDPADRVIVATALTEGIPLVTKDHKLRQYRHVRTLW